MIPTAAPGHQDAGVGNLSQHGARRQLADLLGAPGFRPTATMRSAAASACCLITRGTATPEATNTVTAWPIERRRPQAPLANDRVGQAAGPHVDLLVQTQLQLRDPWRRARPAGPNAQPDPASERVAAAAGTGNGRRRLTSGGGDGGRRATRTVTVNGGTTSVPASGFWFTMVPAGARSVSTACGRAPRFIFEITARPSRMSSPSTRGTRTPHGVAIGIWRRRPPRFCHRHECRHFRSRLHGAPRHGFVTDDDAGLPVGGDLGAPDQPQLQIDHPRVLARRCERLPDQVWHARLVRRNARPVPARRRWLDSHEHSDGGPGFHRRIRCRLMADDEARLVVLALLRTGDQLQLQADDARVLSRGLKALAHEVGHPRHLCRDLGAAPHRALRRWCLLDWLGRLRLPGCTAPDEQEANNERREACTFCGWRSQDLTPPSRKTKVSR